MPRKAIFDAVRDARPEVFKDPAAIHALDNLLDALQIPREDPPLKRTVSPAGLALIHEFEGCARKLPDGRFAAYPDPGSKDGHPWTIGWGSTGPGIAKGVIWTRQQCDDRFANDIQAYADEVSLAIGSAPTTPAQFDALVSFHYNTGAIGKASLTRKHKAGDYRGARAGFGDWIYNDGKPLLGLINRRAAEAKHYGGE